ncbi:MAG: SPOR domain-containing protein [Thermovirgaceae bacterium]|nr:SPOR domain-containing protein [Thermovirgaceae bacterium]
MSIRKTRRFKEKPTIFAFGHIMLPLVGVLALGLLVLGVRLLFVTPGNQVTYPESPGQTEPEQTDNNPAPALPQEQADPAQIVAVPVDENQEPGGGSSPAVQKEPKAAAKTEPAISPQSTVQKSLPSAPVSSGAWVVQIGAFTTKDSAEILAREARGKSYEAFVFKAEVGGKTYYRVRIGAGSQRSDAEKLAGDLASKGYPTLVAHQE